MNMIKFMLLLLTISFLFVTPHQSIASKNPKQIITNQTLDDIFQKNLGKIVAHKAEKPHPHPHNIMMGKKIKKEMKKDKSGMNIDSKRAKSKRPKAKQRDQRSKNFRKNN